MKEEELLRRLASAAEGEAMPRVNVVAQVSAAIRQAREERPGLWWAAAGVSGAMAMAAAVVAMQMLSTWMDPLNQWFNSFDTVLR